VNREEAVMAKTYRVAVIGRTGKGGYGHNLDIVWKELDNVQIVAVADPTPRAGPRPSSAWG